MAYDRDLETRIELLSVNWPGLSLKKMFGGLGYLMNGNMAFGIWRDKLVVRCGPANYESALSRSGVGPFDVTGRAMTGWVLVSPDTLEIPGQLLAWLEMGRDFAATLPTK